jgi:hypothetical protein
MANSPFLPDTNIQFAWDSTSLGWLKQCPRMYQYFMIEGWRGRTGQVHLDFGIWFHQALEVYYKLRAQGESHDDSVHQVTQLMLQETWLDGKPWTHDFKSNKNRETLVRSVVWYLENWKDDPAKTLVLDDGTAAVELTFKMELDYGPEDGTNYLLSGHLDRIVTLGDDTFIMDHKTTEKTLSANYFDSFKPDNQMTLYTVASQVVFHTPVKGVLIDGVQVLVGGTNFARGVTYRNPEEIEEWLADTSVWLRQAEAFAEEDYWPMNDKSCRFCTFREVCDKSPSMRPRMLESHFDHRPWNPLEIR